MQKKVASCRVYERKGRPGVWTIDMRKLGRGPTVGSYPSKADAISAMVEAVHNFNNGTIVAPMAVALTWDAAKKFMAAQKDRKDDGYISQSHYDEIVRSVQYCLGIRIDGKVVGKHNIDALMKQQNRDEVGRALLRGIKAEGKSKATAEKRIKCLKMLFNYAVTKGWGMVNPLDKLSLGMSSEVSDRAPRIQPENIQAIVATLDDESLLTKAMVLTAIASGMRQGELRSLPWANVNFEDCTVKIDSAVKHGNQPTVGDTKTKRGRRIVPVPAEVIAILRQLKVSSKHSANNDFVFANEVGNVQIKRKFAEIMARICKRAGVPLMLWGDFRHFFASVQISSLGEDWGEVAALMGHANSAFTYRQYGHYVKNVEKQKQVSSATAAAMGI